MSRPERSPDILELARRAPHGESTRRDARSFAVFEARLERRARRPVYRGLAALAIAMTVALAWWSWPGEPLASPLTYQITRERAAAPGAPEPQVSLLRFSDGSTVSLGGASTAHVASTTSHGARVLLRRGSATVAVVPRQGNAWDVEAGPYRVHVTGTAFTVSWDPERQRFGLQMQHGSVEVHGPLAGRGVALRAGQRLTSSLSEQRMVVDRIEPSLAAADPARATAMEASGSEPKGEEARGPSSQARAARSPRLTHRDFAQLVIDGRFEEVVREARRIGTPRVLESAAVDELTALADAARYTRENELARRALLALQRRFPSSSSGRSAAFFLARVSNGEESLRWVERYLTREPKGAYTSEALGHAMTLYRERGELERAKGAARRYLSLKPAGPYAASARRLLEDGSAQGR